MEENRLNVCSMSDMSDKTYFNIKDCGYQTWYMPS